jgi:hypothetical protein
MVYAGFSITSTTDPIEYTDLSEGLRRRRDDTGTVRNKLNLQQSVLVTCCGHTTDSSLCHSTSNAMSTGCQAFPVNPFET